MDVWHDVLNNAHSSHRTNKYRTACVAELTNNLTSKKQQILAITYCRREGTPDLFNQLLGTGVLINPATKRILSMGKLNDPEQLRKNLKQGQTAELELKSLQFVVAHHERLAELVGNVKQQRPSQTRKNAKARREQTLKAEEESALQRQG